MYTLGPDPLQQRDVSGDHPRIVQQLRAALCAVYNTGERDQDWFTQENISDRMRGRLERLGSPYLDW